MNPFRPKKSLISKLDVFYTGIIAAILLLIAVCIGTISSRMLREKATETLEKDLEFIAERLHGLFDSVENASLSFIVDEASSEFESDLENMTKYEQQLYINSVSAHLRNFYYTQKNIDKVAFLDVNFILFEQDYMPGSITVYPGDIDERILSFYRGEQQICWMADPLKDTSVPNFLLVRKSYRTGGDQRGIFMVTIDSGAMRSICSNILSEGFDLIITDAQGEICFATTVDMIREEEKEIWRDGYSNDYLLASLGFQGTAFELTALASKAVIYHDVQVLVMTIATIGIAGFLLSLLLLSRASRFLMAPLKTIVRNINALSAGDYSVRTQIDSQDELGLLAEQINDMAENTQCLMNKIQEDGARQRTYELTNLQLQMQPHFLYNTLETINGMIEMDDKKGAIELVSDISRFYRSVLHYGESIITIGEELEIAKNYLKIMQKRYHYRFVFRSDVPQEIRRCRIPKLIFQPILENAVYHGLVVRQRPGNIEISGREADGWIILQIRDDGVGMAQTQAARVLSDAQGPRSFGLKSIEERLKLFFHGDASLSIDSAPQEGTTITLRFPANLPDEQKGSA